MWVKWYAILVVKRRLFGTKAFRVTLRTDEWHPKRRAHVSHSCSATRTLTMQYVVLHSQSTSYQRAFFLPPKWRTILPTSIKRPNRVMAVFEDCILILRDISIWRKNNMGSYYGRIDVFSRYLRNKEVYGKIERSKIYFFCNFPSHRTNFLTKNFLWFYPIA